MNSSVINGLFGIGDSLFGIGGAALDAEFQRQLAKQQFEYQQKLAEQQNDYNVENYRMQWSDQKSWNNESSQVARRRAAGLNPVAGDVAPSTGASASVGAASQGSAPSFHPTKFADALSGVMDRAVQRRAVESQSKLNEAKAMEILGQTPNSKSQKGLFDSQKNLNDQKVTTEKSIKALNDATAALRNSMELTERQRRDLTEVEVGLRTIQYQLANLDYRRQMSTVKVRQGDKEVSLPYFLADSYLKGYEIMRTMNDAKTSYYQAQSAHARAGIDFMNFQTWNERYRMMLADMASQIRLRNSESAAREFTNKLNDEMREAIKDASYSRYRVQWKRDWRDYERIDNGTDEAIWLWQSIVPFVGN